MKREKAIKKALLVALEALRIERGEELYGLVRPIVLQNHDDGTVEIYLRNNYPVTPRKYVFNVADRYEEVGKKFVELVNHRSEEAWYSFFEVLEQECLQRLQRNGLYGSLLTERAQEHISKVAEEILKGGYRYEYDWMAWVNGVVRNVCRNGARSNATQKNKIVTQSFALDQLEMHLTSSEQTDDLSLNCDIALDLNQVILKHCTETEIIYLEKKYVFGWSDAAIGKEVGFSQPVMSRMHKQILEKLRGLL